jgi:hypothetical protein
VLGRWTQPDSILPNVFNPQSLNHFSFVRNNPLRYTDPTGHLETGPCGAFGQECGSSGSSNGSSADNDNHHSSVQNPDPLELSQSDPQPLIDYSLHTRFGDDAREYVYFFIYYREHLPPEWGPGEFTIEEFLGLIMLYERYGAIQLEGYLVQAVRNQLWTGDDFTTANWGGPYCTASPCFNGVLNFLARYSQSAHTRFDRYKAGTLVITLPGEQGALDNDIFTSNVRERARELGRQAMMPPSTNVLDHNLPYHFGNWDVAPIRFFGKPWGNFYVTPP